MHAVPFGPLKSQASVRFWKEGHKVNAQRAGGEDDTGTDRSTQKAKVKMWNDLSLCEIFIIGFSPVYAFLPHTFVEIIQ